MLSCNALGGCVLGMRSTASQREHPRYASARLIETRWGRARAACLGSIAASQEHATHGHFDEQEHFSFPQLRDLEASLLSASPTSHAADGSGDASGGGVAATLSRLATSGCPATVLRDIAAASCAVTAADGTPTDGADGSAADAAVAAAVHDAMRSALATLGSVLLGETNVTDAHGEGAGAQVSDATGEAGQVALARLMGTLRCLDCRPGGASNGGAEGDGTAALQALRDAAWGQLLAFTDGLAAEQFQSPLVAAVLDAQAALGSKTVRTSGWVGALHTWD